MPPFAQPEQDIHHKQANEMINILSKERKINTNLKRSILNNHL